MKTKTIISTIVMVLMGISSALAQNFSTSFKALGNCGMCENRIETAAKNVKGVSSAEWDKTTKMVTVVMDTTVTHLNAVQKAVAKVGHDTDKVKATTEVYNALPGCCKYERAAAKK